MESQLGPFSAAYVLFLAVLGPLLARWIELGSGADPVEGSSANVAVVSRLKDLT